MKGKNKNYLFSKLISPIKNNLSLNPKKIKILSVKSPQVNTKYQESSINIAQYYTPINELNRVEKSEVFPVNPCNMKEKSPIDIIKENMKLPEIIHKKKAELIKKPIDERVSFWKSKRDKILYCISLIKILKLTPKEVLLYRLLKTKFLAPNHMKR